MYLAKTFASASVMVELIWSKNSCLFVESYRTLVALEIYHVRASIATHTISSSDATEQSKLFIAEVKFVSPFPMVSKANLENEKNNQSAIKMYN